MMVKQNQDGTLYLTYDDVYPGVISNTVSSSSVINSVESVIEEITKKPEVRVEQRSALEVKGRVVAKFYKDGFLTDSKDLIPAIKSIEVFNENTVKVTFVNGSVQKSTAQKGDVFSLEDGLLRCIVKEMIGKEGTAILGKLLSYATDVYNKAEAEKKQKVEEEEKKRITAEKNRKKLQKHWEKKRAMEREKRIQEMAEAIVRAKGMERK
jgi:hypothetical protein